MSTTALIIAGVFCLMFFSAMTGIIGGYFLFAGKFTGDAAIFDDLVDIVSDVIPDFESEAPPAPNPVHVSAAPVAKQSVPIFDPTTALTLAPPAPKSEAASAPPVVTRPSQGDLSLDDFFSDFSVAAGDMSGDIPGPSGAANADDVGLDEFFDSPPPAPRGESVADDQILESASEGT